MSDDLVTCTFTVNGGEITHTARAKRSILDVFREDLGYVAAKPGCSPQAICGCCTMILSGKAKVTCTLPFRALDGKEVQTLEGFPEEDRALLAEAFVATGASQCGYCTPGIAVTTKALLDEDPEPDGAALEKALQMHVCRCTGWARIMEAMRLAGRMRRGEAPIPDAAVEPDEGAGPSRNDGRALVLGELPFVDDMSRPGMLHGALVRSPCPRGRVVRVDASKALAIEGVVAAITAEALDGDRRVGLLSRERPVLVGPGEETRCAADVLCALAATSRELAYRAAELVEVEIEELPAATSLEAAAEDPARLVATAAAREGDVEGALAAEGLVVVHERFEVSPVEPAFLEPEAALAVPRADGVLHLYDNGQSPSEDRRQLLELLDLAEEELVLEQVSTGGGFGGRLELHVQPYAALLARATKRPVKLSLTMEESTAAHPKRPAMILDLALAAGPDGELVALRGRILADCGGYAGLGRLAVERAVAHVTGVYRIPAVEVEARAIATNNPPGGALRGFAASEVTFALEGCVDRLADELERDPLDLRAQSAAGGEASGVGAILEAARPHVERARAAGKHVGVACARYELSGRRFSGPWWDPEGEELPHGGQAWATQVAILDAEGALEEVVAVHELVAGADRASCEAQVEGGVQMGVGFALSEELAVEQGRPDVRFRNLGLIKARGAPTVTTVAVDRRDPVGTWPDKGAGEIAPVPTAPAIAAAVRSFEGAWRALLPMKDTPAAWSVGVKKPRRARGA